jgi:arylsulfatase A-like enzyme
VVWKGKLNGEQRVDFPAYTSDYLPTILDVLNIEYPDVRPLDGLNLMPFIAKPTMERVKPMGFRYKEQISWLNQKYKIISKDNGQSYELYDIIEDEEEQHNLADSRPEIHVDMRRELENWLESLENSNKGNDYQ